MHITDRTYLPQYGTIIGHEVAALLKAFDFAARGMDTGYSTQASAVYSANIEGNSINLNSFMNARMSPGAFKKVKEIQEIEDLIAAYEFAQQHPLTEKALLHCHKTLSKTFLIASARGKYRDDKVGVFGESGLVYLAIEPEFLKATMKEFFKEITELLKTELSAEEAFYHAALIHLKFAHIHPFRDGNGRAARLLEKWFLAEKLGAELWKLPSEKYYKEHQPEYYDNINLGVNYYELDYSKCLPFLKMLPESLRK